MASRDPIAFLISGFLISLLLLLAPVSGENNSRLAQAIQTSESDPEEEEVAQLKDKSKFKSKAKTASKSKRKSKQPQAKQKSDSERLMKAGGGMVCPPGQKPLGSSRRGGCG